MLISLRSDKREDRGKNVEEACVILYDNNCYGIVFSQPGGAHKLEFLNTLKNEIFSAPPPCHEHAEILEDL